MMSNIILDYGELCWHCEASMQRKLLELIFSIRHDASFRGPVHETARPATTVVSASTGSLLARTLLANCPTTTSRFFAALTAVATAVIVTLTLACTRLGLSNTNSSFLLATSATLGTCQRIFADHAITPSTVDEVVHGEGNFRHSDCLVRGLNPARAHIQRRPQLRLFPVLHIFFLFFFVALAVTRVAVSDLTLLIIVNNIFTLGVWVILVRLLSIVRVVLLPSDHLL
mmetsp:Transcript_35046/g.65411  ORF Transcript_35046/g.65411 Transcript_35046/m.65411 type:complete len:228 (+) Transcript_35046:152-835(+)